jgi:thymidylate synthase (FAD)
MTKVGVLDRGHVDLVDCMGSDLTVCNAARVSFASETEWGVDEAAKKRLEDSDSHFSDECIQKLKEKDAKLIKYLANHNHWTPFAHPQITLRIKAPISIRTQFFKHKQGFVENEISRRYVTFEPEFYIPKWRGSPSGSAKQGSDDFLKREDVAISDICYNRATKQCLKSYNYLIERGVAPEQARFALPQGMYTEWYWTGSLAAYARFYKQRSEEHAQWEIREYADAVGKVIQPLFPISWKALIQ